MSKQYPYIGISNRSGRVVRFIAPSTGYLLKRVLSKRSYPTYVDDVDNQRIRDDELIYSWHEYGFTTYIAPNNVIGGELIEPERTGMKK